jgi:hypothetical protein
LGEELPDAGPGFVDVFFGAEGAGVMFFGITHVTPCG